MRAAVVLHLGMGEVRGWTQWESVVREGRGLHAVLCVGLKAAHLLNDYPYVLVQYTALSEYSFPLQTDLQGRQHSLTEQNTAQEQRH